MKRVGIDRNFGSNGYAPIPLSAKASFWDSEAVCAAGSSGALVGITYNSDAGKPNGAALFRYDSSGRRIWRAGLTSREIPRDIHPTSGNRWIVGLKHGSGYLLVRYLSNGRRDRSFGDGGRLALSSDDLRWLRDGSFVHVDTATVFTKNGRPDRRMHGDGRIVTGFAVDDVLEAQANTLLVLGRIDGQYQLAKINRAGEALSGWNGGAPVQLGEPPESSWKSHLVGGQSEFTEATAEKFSPSLDRVTSTFVDLNYYALVTLQAPKYKDEVNLYLRHRLTSTGAVDTALRGTGWQFLSADSTDDELEADDDEHWVEREVLADGRAVKASFTVGSEIDPGSWSSFSVSDRGGRFDTHSARTFRVDRLRFGDYDFDRKGRTMYFCGMHNFSRWVVGRVRL